MQDKQFLTKDEFKSLVDYEKQLHTAMVGSYATGITKATIDLFYNILKAHNIILPNNYSCNVCKINIMKALASLYFNTKNKKRGGKK